MAKKRGYRTGSIYQRKSDHRWCGSYIKADGTRRTLYGNSRDAVFKSVASAVTAEARGEATPNKKLLTRDFLNGWLEQCKTSGKIQPGTLKTYESYSRLHLIPALGQKPLSQLSVDDVQHFFNINPKILSPHALRYCRTVLRVALNAALRQDKVTKNVAALAEPPAEKKVKRGRPLTPQETDINGAFMRDVMNHRLGALWLMEVTTAMRPGEALGLRWAAPGLTPDDGVADLTAKRAYIRRALRRITKPTPGWELAGLKTDASRRDLQLPQVLVDALQKVQDRREFERKEAGNKWHEDIPDLVFTTQTGGPLHTSTSLHEIQKIMAKHGLLVGADGKKRRQYDLRHTAITWLLRNGQSLHEVKEIAGHASITMTSDVYGDILEEGKVQAANIMDALLGQHA